MSVLVPPVNRARPVAAHRQLSLWGELHPEPVLPRDAPRSLQPGSAVAARALPTAAMIRAVPLALLAKSPGTPDGR